MVGMQSSDFEGAVPVDGYGPGFFRIAGQVHHGALLIHSSGAQPWGGLSDRETLLALSGGVDVLFLGMGADMAHAPRDLVDQLQTVGIMVESMSTPSAARSYNVTLSEGRRVACALLPV